MLYLIGLGLYDERDLSLRAIELMRKCDEVFAETYTSKWHGDFKKLGNLVKKKIKILEREDIESDFLIDKAKSRNVVLLVPGDPLIATTHIELLIQAKKHGIETKVIHSSSIYTAVAESGLQIYKFGRTTSLPFPEKGFEPTSPYDVIADNKKIGLHTLILLEKDMKVSDGLKILLNMEKKKGRNIINENKKVIVCCQLGSENQVIRYDKIGNLMGDLVKEVPAIIIIPGKLHFKEEEFLSLL